MTKKLVVVLSAVLVVCMAFAAGLLVGKDSAQLQARVGENVIITADQYKTLKAYTRLSEIEQLIGAYYYQDYDLEALHDGAAKGMVAYLGDLYAAYYTPAEVLDLTKDQAGNYEGIGVQVIMDADGLTTVTTVFRDSPALEAGMQIGDKIVAVDETDVRGFYLDDVVALMKGPPDTSVEILVLRGEEYVQMQVDRAEITANRVFYRMIGEIGYISIDAFTGDDVKGFKEAIAYIENNNAKALIIDLRNNGGGLVDDVVEIANILLPEGIVVYTEDKYGKRVEETSDMRFYPLPLAVLVNEYTASSSEILAGAIQDYETGVLVGMKTYGKGIVQTQIPFKDGAALKLTTAYYYTPKGRCIHGAGLTPDYEVQNSDEARANPYLLADEDDAQLQKALEVLREQLGQ